MYSQLITRCFHFVHGAGYKLTDGTSFETRLCSSKTVSTLNNIQAHTSTLYQHALSGHLSDMKNPGGCW